MNDKDKRRLLGLKIQRLRKLKNLTQESLSEKIGIDPASLSKVENGVFFPSLPNFIKIAEVFDITPNELLEVEHLQSDETLEKEMISILKSQSTERKQLLYKLLKSFKD